MSIRKQSFENEEYYHIYNRGVDKRTIFEDAYDTQRFLKSIIEFNVPDPIGSLYANSFRQLSGETPKLEERLVDIIAYCLNPNHFHFILKQIRDGGISEFMKRLGGGYTSYFNNKYARTGALFQGVFKDKHIGANEYLLHVSAYVNLNDRVHKLSGETSKLVESKSSWNEYIDEKVKGICEKEIVLGQFRNSKEYKEFATDSLELMLQRKEEQKDLAALFIE